MAAFAGGLLTGRLHIGHDLAPMRARVDPQDSGVETFVLIADYEVITDRTVVGDARARVIDSVVDHLAGGLDPAHTADDTAARVRKAVTDSERHISYDPEHRPEVATLLLVAALMRGQDPTAPAARIGDGGARRLKGVVIDATTST